MKERPDQSSKLAPLVFEFLKTHGPVTSMAIKDELAGNNGRKRWDVAGAIDVLTRTGSKGTQFKPTVNLAEQIDLAGNHILYLYPIEDEERLIEEGKISSDVHWNDNFRLTEEMEETKLEEKQRHTYIFATSHNLAKRK